jgi:8-oxo-dGTP diphosphatase
MAGSARIAVVAGAVFDVYGAVLIAQRPPGKHLAGGWEFPGGKVAADEEDGDALARELREELGIAVLASQHFMTLTHEYSDRVIELRMRLVTSWRGEPRGLDGQALRWVAVRDLDRAPILDADRPFILALQRHAAGAK